MTTTAVLPRPLPAAVPTATPTLHDHVAEVLTGVDDSLVRRRLPPTPRDERDGLLALLALLDLHLAPIGRLGAAVALQHDPDLTRLRNDLEERFLRGLRAETPVDDDVLDDPARVTARARAIAARDAVPPVYDWVAERATGEQLRAFLALEGGPDAGFDDLVALAQVGLAGEPKLELACNYWDEMGRGESRHVHTALHHDMARAAGLPTVRREDLPVPALARAALGSVLAVNRALQPELVGALGLLELQAGPRCRKVVAGLHRTGAPDATLPFYEEHARTDPRHGKDWLDHVITPLAHDRRWAAGMLRGIRWRALVNQRFLTAVGHRFGVRP